jgi:hypothetical protein
MVKSLSLAFSVVAVIPGHDFFSKIGYGIDEFMATILIAADSSVFG